MSTTVKVVLALVGITLLAAFLFRRIVFHKLFDEDDERPPIIVLNGSLMFESQKNWKKDPAGHRFKPDHPRGRSVGSYMVMVTGSSTPACSGTTLNGLEVFVDYLADAAAPVKQFHLYRRLAFSMPGTVKREPALDSPEPLTNLPATGTTAARLVYPVGPEGWISNVRVGNTSCAFTRPANEAARKAVRVEIKPAL
jgi:hypothetical protein